MRELWRTERVALLRRATGRVGVGLIVAYMLLQAAASFTHVVDLQASRLNGTADPGIFEDYVAYYSASDLLLHGKADQIYNTDVVAAAETQALGRPVGESGGVLPFFNPPFVSVMTVPLALLGLKAFSTSLLIAVVAMIIAGGVGLQRIVEARSSADRAFLWLAFLSFAPMAWLLGEEQLSMLIFLGWLGFVWFQLEDKPSSSGACLALALVKPQMVLLPVVILVWKRQWSALRSFASIAAVLALVSIVVAGPGVLVEYPRLILQSTHWQGQGVRTDHMYGWNSVLAVLTHHSAPSLLLSVPLTIATLAVALVAWRGPWPKSSDVFLKQMSVLLLASLLVNPHLYQQDLVLGVLVFGFLVAAATRRRSEPGRWAGPAVVTWVLGIYGPRLLYEHSVPLVPFVFAAVLGALTISLIREGREAATEPGFDAMVLNVAPLSEVA